jgi:ferredoxin/flavodoxin---NADP+ reductase
LQAVPSGQTSTLDAGLVLRAIGYRGSPMPGLPFDAVRAVIRNVQGRVVGDDGAALPGVYTTGWIKRGCRGVIGSNRKCARETVDSLVDDWTMGLGGSPALSKDAVLALVSKRQPAWVSLGGWLAIDRHERSAGRQKQRPRVKLTDIPSMLDAAKLRDEGPGGPRLARDVES